MRGRELSVMRSNSRIGTVRNYDGDGNGNVEKAIGLMCKTTLQLYSRVFTI